MAEDKVTATFVGGACGQCHITIAPFAAHVIDGSLVYHRECYEAWYFRRHDRRPTVMPDANGDRQRWRIRDRAA